MRATAIQAKAKMFVEALFLKAKATKILPLYVVCDHEGTGLRVTTNSTTCSSHSNS